MTDTIDALVQQALGRALAKAVKVLLLKEDA